MIKRHGNWKGDKARYISIHTWIHYNFGKANKCESKNCLNSNAKNFEWANISGNYKRIMSDWKMLCHSCHSLMDYKKRFGNFCKSGHKYTKENTYIEPDGKKRRCRTCRLIKKY